MSKKHSVLEQVLGMKREDLEGKTLDDLTPEQWEMLGKVCTDEAISKSFLHTAQITSVRLRSVRSKTKAFLIAAITFLLGGFLVWAAYRVTTTKKVSPSLKRKQSLRNPKSPPKRVDGKRKVKKRYKTVKGISKSVKLFFLNNRNCNPLPGMHSKRLLQILEECPKKVKKRAAILLLKRRDLSISSLVKLLESSNRKVVTGWASLLIYFQTIQSDDEALKIKLLSLIKKEKNPFVQAAISLALSKFSRRDIWVVSNCSYTYMEKAAISWMASSILFNMTESPPIVILGPKKINNIDVFRKENILLLLKDLPLEGLLEILAWFSFAERQSQISGYRGCFLPFMSHEKALKMLEKWMKIKNKAIHDLAFKIFPVFISRAEYTALKVNGGLRLNNGFLIKGRKELLIFPDEIWMGGLSSGTVVMKDKSYRISSLKRLRKLLLRRQQTDDVDVFRRAIDRLIQKHKKMALSDDVIEGGFTIAPRALCHFLSKVEKMSCSFAITGSKPGEFYRLSAYGTKIFLDGKKISFEKEFVVKIDKFSGFKIEFLTKGLKRIEFQFSNGKKKFVFGFDVWRKLDFGPAKKRPIRPKD